ncbi:MAG: glutamine synthetase type III, partial [Solirubrobacteraceae bacterium]|nr:glutamine synthetase type III [Solirubrobacteraceae bacterium]
DSGVGFLKDEVLPLVEELNTRLKTLADKNLVHPFEDEDAQKHAQWMHDEVIPAMNAVRDTADQLEGIIADDLWPLPRYSEILFIK